MFLNSVESKNITKVNRTSLLEIIGDQDMTSRYAKTHAVDTIMHFIRGRHTQCAQT